MSHLSPNNPASREGNRIFLSPGSSGSFHFCLVSLLILPASIRLRCRCHAACSRSGFHIQNTAPVISFQEFIDCRRMKNPKRDLMLMRCFRLYPSTLQECLSVLEATCAARKRLQLRRKQIRRTDSSATAYSRQYLLYAVAFCLNAAVLFYRSGVITWNVCHLPSRSMLSRYAPDRAEGL